MSRFATTRLRDALYGQFSAHSQRAESDGGAADYTSSVKQTARSHARAGGGLGLAEIHAHTLASDGMVSAEDLVRAAAGIGLNVLCITDHDTISELGPAIEVGAGLGVDVVRGEEVTASFPPGIHIVGLFLERQIRMHMSVEDTVDAIHDAGGLAVIAHPFMPTWFASMTPGKARQLLESHCREGLSSWQVPREFQIVTELPFNQRGKINRSELSRLHLESRSNTRAEEDLNRR